METIKSVFASLWTLQRNVSIYLTGRSVLDDYLNHATRSLVASILTPLVAFCIAVSVAWLTMRWLPTLWHTLVKAFTYVVVLLVATAVGFVVFTLVIKYTEPPVTWFVDYVVARVMPDTVTTSTPPVAPTTTLVQTGFCPSWAWWICAS